ncbi:unnamed protein product (macronuclear) [Paramecium tetraurelia]|uniref:Uncharacterized protein n=1 Tax=Paramecium tetraurelia TaxID=5888 RepID=A0DFQ9_PARTE|nr:uncharacterized protein GSPATT00016689001 [Paramecium tetraurelia]CAK81876.1 unnamed protein product [Paramecium tetraurelia]|eukprot:XP_001449273.1 hypothetical protein (macronuclear) [Paramecium tetraurelia strain d4-2]
MQFLVKSSRRVGFFGFATATATHKDIAGKNFLKFQSKYAEYVTQFNQKLEAIEKENKAPNVAPQGKAFEHPYNNPHNPVNMSGIKSSELFYNFIGPEQVSPHYENFLVARKYLLLTYGGLIVIGFAAGTTNLHWIAKSSFLPFLFWMQIMYFYLEGRKSFMKPLLARFYRRVAGNECFQLDQYYHENMQLKIRTLLEAAKGQIEYGQLHKEFKDVKAELINTFLMNEQLNLQRHVAERSSNILKQAQQAEQINQNRLLSDIIEAAQESLETNLKNNLPEIQKALFKSALRGLAQGKMTYENDPLIDMILKTITEHVSKIQNLSPAEQKKLISLSKDQLAAIQANDKKAKEDFLRAEPKIDQTLKNYDNVKRQLASWGQ